MADPLRHIVAALLQFLESRLRRPPVAVERQHRLRAASMPRLESASSNATGSCRIHPMSSMEPVSQSYGTSLIPTRP
mgnify:CR=1 FL=1